MKEPDFVWRIDVIHFACLITHTTHPPQPAFSTTTQLVLCGMALFRVGSLMRFVSPSVLTGFVTGSAVYIFISQSKYIWGFKVRACVCIPLLLSRPVAKPT